MNYVRLGYADKSCVFVKRFFALNSNLIKIAGLFIVAIFLLRFCWGAGYNSYRYLITVNVEANGKTYSGSSVQVQSTTTSPDWISSILLPETKRKGEAVVVNVDGKYLFLLWNYSIDDDPNYQNGDKPWQVDNIWKNIKYGKYGQYAQYRYPFVTFTDINDPLTVKQVTQENFEQYFGEGAKITSIEVQRTLDQVTYGKVERVIPWIKSLKTTLDGKDSTSSMDLANKLDRSFFILDY